MPTDPKDKPIRWDYDIYRQEFRPRLEPRPVPETGILEEPLYCMTFNAAWMPHILGALELLLQPDSWSGGDDEVFRAQQNIYEMLASVGICGGTDAMRIVELRSTVTVDGCNQHQWKYLDEAPTLWRNLGNPVCDGPTGPTGADGECPECPPAGTVPPEITVPVDEGFSCGGAYGVVSETLEILNYNLDQIDLYVGAIYDAANFITLNLLNTLRAAPAIGLVVEAVTAIAGYTVSAVRSAINHPSFDDDVACMLFCAVRDEGAFNQTSFTAWIDAMKELWTNLDARYAYIDLVERQIGYGSISRLFALESLIDDDRCAAGCDCSDTWAWAYASSVCDYGLPTGWTLNVVAGSCGDGPGTFDGLYHFGGGGTAVLNFTITPAVGETIKAIRMSAARNTVSATTQTIRVQQSAFDQTQTLLQGFNNYTFSPDQTGTITVTLTHAGGSGFNGVGVRSIEIDYE